VFYFRIFKQLNRNHLKIGLEGGFDCLSEEGKEINFGTKEPIFF
jgi:hypothetical protein